MKKDFNDMISSYLDDDLSLEEKKSFENYMQNHSNFSNKVKNIKNIISLVKQAPKLETSKDFLNNLETNIDKKSIFNYWLNPKLKTTLSFGFVVIVLFFIVLNDYNFEEEVADNVTMKNFNSESLANIETDTLKNDNFKIIQVKGQKSNK
tara:strand:- start:42 stop:491 length:450 start_codon:yes stop_codon:yes gene_type:complete